MDRPNVLLIVADSVRARNTSLHNHCYDTTPLLTELAKTSTVYTQARAPSNWSLPSHTSMFTGYHVREHDVTDASDRIKAGETIFDELREDGYKTAVFSENPYLTSLETGLVSGFDTVEGAVREQPFDGLNPDEYKGELRRFLRESLLSGSPIRSLANGVISKMAWDYPELIPEKLRRNLSSGVTPGSVFTDLFREWATNRTEPWAACINYMDAHHPYAPREEFNVWDDGTIQTVQDSISSMPLGFYIEKDPWWKCEILEHLYDGTIRQIDNEIDRLIQFLEDQGEFDNTLVIITSDHGEGFGEESDLRGQRLAGHNLGEHEVNLHVPLLIKRPEQDTASKTTDPVTLTAIPAVIRRAVSGDSEVKSLRDYSVLARTRGPLDDQMKTIREEGVNIESFQGQADILYEKQGGKIKKCVSWKDQKESMMIRDDPIRKVNAEEVSLEEVLDELENAFIKQESNKGELDKETEQHLKDLGYR